MYAQPQGKQKPVEQEVITEENGLRPDETVGFSQAGPHDLFISRFLLACTVLSYASPAPPELADLATITHVPRPEWFFSLRADAHVFSPATP